MSASLLAALLMQAGTTPPPAPAPAGRVVRPPDVDFLYAYPTGARHAGVEGQGTVTCAVSASGALSNCRAVGEDPAGFGFGVAAASMAPRYRMEPATPGGPLPPEATFPIAFRLRAAYGSLIRVDAHDGWAVLQQPFVWQEHYPPKAEREKVAGVAEVKCGPGRKGKALCEVLSETPGGYGFGKAALKIQSLLRLSPPPGGPQATGRTVRTTVRFDPERD